MREEGNRNPSARCQSAPGSRFVWVGKRSMLYHPLKVRRAMKDCPDNVRFMHDVEDIADAHCGCDIFFTPSLAENQGMAVMEAMAVGRPVVARNLQAYDGLLVNGESAIVRTLSRKRGGQP